MKRSARLFALAEALRARRTGVTAEELATRFGVTVRTIYRDLDALREAHLPLQAERGRGGGYALDRAYTLPPVNFTAREAAVLLALGRFADEMRALPFPRTLRQALDKVRAALDTAKQRELSRRLDELSFVGVPQVPTGEGVREAFEEAWLSGAPFEFTYLRDSVETRRRVEVLRVLADRTETRFVGRDLDKGEEREFVLQRVVAVGAGTKRGGRPRGG